MAVFIAILFPPISVSDDLQAIQQVRFGSREPLPRRDQFLCLPNPSPVQPMLAVILPAINSGLGFGFLRFIAANLLPVLEPEHPEIAGIDNRPPPVA